MTAAELRPEVEQAVAGVDLAAAQRQQVGSRPVGAGLARNGKPEAGVRDQASVAGAEETGGVAERFHRPPELRLERDLRAGDLVPRGLVAESEEIRMRDGVSLEPQRPAAVELDDVLPPEQGRLLPVPTEAGSPVDGA